MCFHITTLYINDLQVFGHWSPLKCFNCRGTHQRVQCIETRHRIKSTKGIIFFYFMKAMNTWKQERKLNIPSINRTSSWKPICSHQSTSVIVTFNWPSSPWKRLHAVYYAPSSCRSWYFLIVNHAQCHRAARENLGKWKTVDCRWN